MGFRFLAGFGLALLSGVTITATPLSAQDREVPYWAALRYDEVRMRVGPSEEYPIQWVYKRKGLPVTLEIAADAVEAIVLDGVLAAQNKFNTSA